MLHDIGVPFLIENLNSNSEDYVNSVQYFIQIILNALSGMDVRDSKKPDKKLMAGYY